MIIAASLMLVVGLLGAVVTPGRFPVHMACATALAIAGLAALVWAAP